MKIINNYDGSSIDIINEDLRKNEAVLSLRKEKDSYSHYYNFRVENDLNKVGTVFIKNITKSAYYCPDQEHAPYIKETDKEWKRLDSEEWKIANDTLKINIQPHKVEEISLSPRYTKNELDEFMSKIKIALIQMHVEEDKYKNLETANTFIKKVAQEGCDLAILPEMFTTPYKTDNFPIYAEFEGEDSFISISNMAKENSIYLVGGSIPEKDEKNLVYNTSYVFDRNGNNIGKHRKVHLFDIDVEGGQSFKESDTLTPGNNITVFDTEFGKIGLCICFDFRFPELARLMVQKGAKTIIVPAAFNMTTGPAHWDLMFRSRAIDNQVYAIGCAPSRDINGPYVSYGNSIVTTPWGDILYKMDEKEGYKILELDLEYVDKIRKELPLISARRLDLYELKEK